MASTYLVLLWIMGVTAFMIGCGNDVGGNVGGPGPTVTVPGATSTATVTASPFTAPAQLAFTVQPGQVEHPTLVSSTASPSPGGAFAATVLPAFVVAIEDSNGHVVTTATNAVTIALGNNPNNATLLGTLTVNAVNGLATFNDVEITNAGVGFTLVASSPGLSGATSGSLTVQPLPLVFDNATSILCGDIPTDVTLADFNGDGHVDIAFNNAKYSSSSHTGGVVTVLLGNGDGTFRTPQNFAIAHGSSETGIGIVAADVNKDGHIDLIAAQYGTGVSVLLGNGDGTFQTAANLATVHSIGTRVAVADLNNDGNPDIVATSFATGVSVLLGNGDGTFHTAQNINLGFAELVTPVVADVNGDGKLDLLVSSEYGVVSLLVGNGDGTFQAPNNIAPIQPGAEMLGLVVADLNGDGKLDVAASYLVSGYRGGVQVLLGNGDGTFQAPHNYVTGPSLTLLGADMNLDGTVDLVESGLISNTAIVLTGNGDGTFQVASSVGGGAGIEHIGVGVADLNGDLKPDIVGSGVLPSQVTIILHQ